MRRFSSKAVLVTWTFVSNFCTSWYPASPVGTSLSSSAAAAGGAPGSSPAAPVSAPPSLLEHAITSAATNIAMIPTISANLRRIIYCLQNGYLGLVSTRVIAYSGPSACGKLSVVDSR